MIVTILFRRGSSTEWASANPVLGSGEPGYDETNKIFKIGDGTSHWTELPDGHDLALVHKAGAETITGLKTFTGGLTATGVSVTVGAGLRLLDSQNTATVVLTATSTTNQDFDATAAAFTATLPATTNPGIEFRLKKIDASVNAVTIAAPGGGTIDGQATVVLTSRYDTVTVRSTSTTGVWEIIARYAAASRRCFSIDPVLARSSDSATIAIANNALYYRVSNGGTFTKIGLTVTVSSGNISVAFYKNNGLDGEFASPGTQIGTSGAVACPAIGYANVALTTTTRVSEGDWIAISADNITAAFRSTVLNEETSALGKGRCIRQGTAHPLPGTAGAGSAVIGRNIVLVGTV